MANHWSRSELIKMLVDSNYIPPKITNDENDASIERLPDPENPGKSSIKKTYPSDGNIRQANEYTFLINLNAYSPEIKNSVARLTFYRDATIGGNEGRTRWSGFDIKTWIDILGCKAPFLATIQGQLSLIRGIFRATEIFHAQGFVHNDLHRKNIVIGFEFDIASGIGRMQLNTPKMIDFEYVLFPIDTPNGLPNRGQGFWMKDIERVKIPLLNQESQLINQEVHSTTSNYSNKIYFESMKTIYEKFHAFTLHHHSHHVIPFVSEELPSNSGEYYRAFKADDYGNYIFNSEIFENIKKIDFGVDFFTLSRAIELLIKDAEKESCWDQIHIQNNYAAYSYLKKLPEKLRMFNTVPQTKRSTPHHLFITEIDHLIGPEESNNVTFHIKKEEYISNQFPSYKPKDNFHTNNIHESQLPNSTPIRISTINSLAIQLSNMTSTVKSKVSDTISFFGEIRGQNRAAIDETTLIHQQKTNPIFILALFLITMLNGYIVTWWAFFSFSFDIAKSTLSPLQPFLAASFSLFFYSIFQLNIHVFLSDSKLDAFQRLLISKSELCLMASLTIPIVSSIFMSFESLHYIGIVCMTLISPIFYFLFCYPQIRKFLLVNKNHLLKLTHWSLKNDGNSEKSLLRNLFFGILFIVFSNAMPIGVALISEELQWNHLTPKEKEGHLLELKSKGSSLYGTDHLLRTLPDFISETYEQ